MKRIFFAVALSLAVPALAENNISLQPGSSADVNGTLVKCLGTIQTNQPKCSVNFHGLNNYGVIVGEKEWGTVSGFDTAIKIVIQLKEAGLCN